MRGEGAVPKVGEQHRYRVLSIKAVLHWNWTAGARRGKPGIILFGEGWVGTGRSLQECRDFQGGLPGYPSHFQFRL